MASPKNEFRFNFRPHLIFGVTILIIFSSYTVGEVLSGAGKFDDMPPLGYLFFGGLGLFSISPYFLVKTATIDAEWITFKPLGYRYPIEAIKQIKEVFQDGERIVAVRLITEKNRNVWLPCVMIGGNGLAKITLSNTDGKAFLESLSAHIKQNSPT
jgi:hypothetical protein